MYAGVAYDAYTENNLGIESPIKLIEMLYEGVLRFNAQAKKAIKDGNIEKRVYWTNRSVSVITELQGMLDFSGGNIAKYLDGLYGYQIKLLTEAGLENNMKKLDECTNVFRGLLEAWRESTNVA
jgi:flagellar protein FliS